MSKPIHLSLVEEMEGNLHRHGDNFMGVGWTKSKENADTRYRVMMELLPPSQECTLLDVGCGAAHLYEYMRQGDFRHVTYSGLDLSADYLALCRRKHPDRTFHRADLMAADHGVPMHDYLVLNGIFNYKGEHSDAEMWEYLERFLGSAWKLAMKGLAVNFVSKLVDWERDDLFHLPFDRITSFVGANMSRKMTVRHDYGLFEYTLYIYR